MQSEGLANGKILQGGGTNPRMVCYQRGCPAGGFILKDSREHNCARIEKQKILQVSIIAGKPSLEGCFFDRFNKYKKSYCVSFVITQDQI